MDVDDRVRTVLKQALRRAAAAPVRTGVVRQVGGFVENHVNSFGLQRVAELARHVVDAALSLDALCAVGGNVALVAVGDIHGDELLVVRAVRRGLNCAVRWSEDGLHLARIQPGDIRHGFLADARGGGGRAADLSDAVERVVPADVLVADAYGVGDGKERDAVFVGDGKDGAVVRIVLGQRGRRKEHERKQQTE